MTFTVRKYRRQLEEAYAEGRKIAQLDANVHPQNADRPATWTWGISDFVYNDRWGRMAYDEGYHTGERDHRRDIQRLRAELAIDGHCPWPPPPLEPA